MDKKLKDLEKLIKKVLNEPPEEMIYIYYMYYSEDNPLISKNIPYEMLY